jgi:Kdo2-lipid IVA lauroyltransferase/acyltransferase
MAGGVLRDQAAAVVLRLMGRLPEGAVLRLAPLIGMVLSRTLSRRAWVLEHLSMAFGSELSKGELHRLARAYYEHLFLLFCEMGRLGHWSPEQVLEATHESGLEHLDQALAQGRGAILITGHMGNWELAGAALAHRGYRLSVVSQAQRNAVLEEYLVRMRARHGIRLIAHDAPLDCVKSLRQGRVLVLMIDQLDFRSGLLVPFFDHPATSVAGPAALAAKLRVPVLLGGMWRLPDGTFRGAIEPPIPLVETGDAERDLLENTARFQFALETAIRRFPGQWIWDYRRWRRKGRGTGKGKHRIPKHSLEAS